jgi:hypothetical protein
MDAGRPGENPDKVEGHDHPAEQCAAPKGQATALSKRGTSASNSLVSAA